MPSGPGVRRLGSDLITFQTSAGEKNEVEVNGRVRSWWIILLWNEESMMTFPGGDRNWISKESASRSAFDLGSKMMLPEESLRGREGWCLSLRLEIQGGYSICCCDIQQWDLWLWWFDDSRTFWDPDLWFSVNEIEGVAWGRFRAEVFWEELWSDRSARLRLCYWRYRLTSGLRGSWWPSRQNW